MLIDSERFNQPIGKWNVYIVTNMGFMFYNAYIFNQDIRDCDTSNVEMHQS